MRARRLLRHKWVVELMGLAVAFALGATRTTGTRRRWVVAASLVLLVVMSVAFTISWPRAEGAATTSVTSDDLAAGVSSATSAAKTTSADSGSAASVQVLGGNGAGDDVSATSAASDDLPQLPLSLPPSARSMRVPILMYHQVDLTPPPTGPYSAALTVSPSQFSAEMDYLSRNGYHSVTLERVYAAMAGIVQLPAQPVAITFDDGERDNFTVAFPILESYHFTASFFVITGAVGRPECVSWEDLRVMQAAGMAIESHTVHHPDLRTLSAGHLAAELGQSRVMIFDQLGRRPDCLAYPDGDYNAAVIAQTKSAGYLLAVTTHFGTKLSPRSCYAWPRVRVLPGESLAGFIRSIEAPPVRGRRSIRPLPRQPTA